jgi:hypothetical protein
VERFDQITLIHPDGNVTIWVYEKGASEPLSEVRGFLDLVGKV